jgi:ribosomal protein S18 acetylase RimI-like enzyme
MIARNASTRHLSPGTPVHTAPGAPSVVRPDPSEAQNLAGLVADAFFLLPPSIWLVREPDYRATVMRDYFAIAVEHAFHHGVIETLPDRSAVAVWFDNTRPAPPPADYELRRMTACGKWTERFVYLDGLLERHHPREPHHHLAFLAVAPNAQGTGRGTTLIRHHHASLDAAGIPAYLEAASQRLVPYYEQHGYTKGEPFYLAAGGPAFWPMTREPQPVD